MSDADARSGRDTTEMTVHEAVAAHADAGATLLDVREHDEWFAGHAPDAVHIPLSELEARVAEVPTDGPVSVICRSGARSARATGFLLASGRGARNVIGGMIAWAAAGYPMVSESDAAAQVI
ncbi:MAG: hypothetical protein RI885_1012 [Actinomycetota bacterium]|jgi:rhodanese-related sulfurtransferase